MIPVAKLKHNLQFNKDLGELIEVMKLAATLQFNQFRSRRGPQAESLLLLESAFQEIPEWPKDNIFLNPPAGLPAAIILVSSDEGFLGELNMLLANRLMDMRQPGDTIIVLGRQGADFLEELKVDFISLPSPGEKVEFNECEELRDDVLKRFIKKEIGKVHIIYARFINLTVQQAESEALLPLALTSKPQQPAQKELLIEPDINSLIEGWVKLWLGLRFYQVFWSSKLAEFAARIMHLEASMQELNRINQHLELEYFKYLHSLSDKTIREISASRLARRH